MRKLAFAAGLLLATTQWSHAQDFNPGTVVGNVFQNPRSGCGYGYGLGCYPPDHGRTGRSEVDRHHQVRRRMKQNIAAQR